VNFAELVLSHLSCNIQYSKFHHGNFQKQVESVGAYLRKSYVNIFDLNSLDLDQSFFSSYNIPKWVQEGFSRALIDYELPQSKSFVLRMPEQRANYIREKVDTFGMSKAGIGKMLTRMWLSDLRRESNFDMIS